MSDSRFDVPNGKTAGILLAACAVLTMIAVSHHPTVHAVKAQDVVAGMVRVGVMDGIIHGFLIATMGVLLFSLTVYSLRRGSCHQLVVAALLAYAVAVLALVGAALIDGFLIPRLAALYVSQPPAVIKSIIPLLQFCALAIQVLTKFGFTAMSVAVLLWSIDLLFLRGLPRVVGVIGVGSALTVGFLISSVPNINPHSLGIIVALQALWYLGIATLLIRDMP